MKSGKGIALGGMALVALTMVATTPASAQRRQTGMLTCDLRPSVGLVIGSRQRMQCVFRDSDTGRVRHYAGRIGRIGLDLGFTAGGRMVWAVYSRGSATRHRTLAGSYVGASADIALGFGLGANVLVGGQNDAVALQPLSVQGQVGVNLALGVARLTLQ